MPSRTRTSTRSASRTPVPVGADVAQTFESGEFGGDETLGLQDTVGNAAASERVGAGTGDPDDPRDLPKKQADLDAAMAEVERLLGDDALLVEDVEAELPRIEERYEMQWLRLVEGAPRVWGAEGKVNPQKDVDGFTELDDADLLLIGAALDGLDSRDPMTIAVSVLLFDMTFGEYRDHGVVEWAHQILHRWHDYHAARVAGDTGAQFRPPSPSAYLPPALLARGQQAVELEIQRPRGFVDPSSVGASVLGSSMSDDLPSGKSVAPGSKRSGADAPDVDGGVDDSLFAVEALRERLESGRGTSLAWAKEEIDDIEQVVTALDALGRLYAPDSADEPDRIYADPQPDRIAAVRTSAIDVPANRGQSFPASVEYADGDYRYLVTLLPGATKGAIPAPPRARDFEVKRTPPGRSGTAKGRAYTGDQGFFPNPAYWGEREPDDSVPAPTERERTARKAAIIRFVDEKTARAQGALPQAASKGEPWVFCVPAAFGESGGTPDPKQTGNPGLRRRSPDSSFAEETDGAQVRRATVFQTHTPAKRRGEDGREPQREANGTPAHFWMGSSKDDSHKHDVPAYAGSRGASGSHEYCHLVGDGDSGDCKAENLVVGTNGVNTEQLAMEETLRPYRPLLRRLGYGLRLTVTATIDDTPFYFEGLNPFDPPWASQSIAEWIQYAIEVVPIDLGLKSDEPMPVHTQVMDGQRGVITEAEVEVLKATVARKLDDVLGSLDGLDEFLSGERRDGLDTPVYDRGDESERLPQSPSDGLGLSGEPLQPEKKRMRSEPEGRRSAVLRPGALPRYEEDKPDGPDEADIGRFSQADYLGGGTACAGTSLRAAEGLLEHGFDGLNVEDTVRQGVTDYLAVRAANPAAPSYLASYEMRSSVVDYELQLESSFTIQQADFAPLRAALATDGRAVTITAGGYTVTAAHAQGEYGLFDSHVNDIYGTAYTETFPNLRGLMWGIKDMIAQHGTNLHADIGVEVFGEPDE